MKKIILFFIAISLKVCFAQTNNFPIPDNFCSGSTSSSGFTMTSATSSTNGWVHTPKGELHVLVLFITNESDRPDPIWGGDPYAALEINHW